METKTYAVLIRLEILLIDLEIYELSKTSLSPISVIAKTIDVFFTIPHTEKKIAFLNSENAFNYNNIQHIHTIKLPGSIPYIEENFVKEVFKKINFVDFQRDEYKYYINRIERGFIPFFGLKFKNHKQIEI